VVFFLQDDDGILATRSRRIPVGSGRNLPVCFSRRAWNHPIRVVCPGTAVAACLRETVDGPHRCCSCRLTCQHIMIDFYFHPTPNPAKVALMLEESGLQYELRPIDTKKGEQHSDGFRRINPNGKVPAIVDHDGPAGKEARVFDSNAILLYLAEKSQRFLGPAADRPELLSWLFFISSGLGPFSGQAVHFQRAAPEQLPYAINRFRREAERHYRVLDDHLADREFLVGNSYTIADMAAWGWIDRATFVFFDSDAPLEPFANLKRWFDSVDARPAVARARAIGSCHDFKQEMDEEARRALSPSNYMSR
jgi:GSH-dependent disulfide-bond oxidoreductase